MSRYEGMEDLLQQVRARLGVIEPESVETGPEEGDEEQRYAQVLEALLLVLRDAEGLRASIDQRRAWLLSQDHHDDLMAIFGKVLRELWQCKGVLERSRPPA